MRRNFHQDLNNKGLFVENKPGKYGYYEDEKGKIAWGNLSLAKDTQRDPAAQKAAGGEYRDEHDDGGHLIGARFGGAPDSRNLDAQNSNLNRSSFNKREKSWEEALKNGDKVFVYIETPRTSGGERPDAYMGYSIIEHPDGKREWDAFSFQNASRSEQMEWNEDLYKEDPTLSQCNEQEKKMYYSTTPLTSVAGCQGFKTGESHRQIIESSDGEMGYDGFRDPRPDQHGRIIADRMFINKKTNEVQGINFNDRNGNFCCSYTGMNYSDIKDSNYRDYQEKKQQMEEKREENDKMEDTKQERLIPKMIANNADNADNDGQSSGEGEEPMSNNFRLIPRMIQENRREAQAAKEEAPSEQNTNANRFQNIPTSQSESKEDENEYQNDDSMTMGR